MSSKEEVSRGGARLGVRRCAARGPMHGHQIRNQAQSDRTEHWTEVKVGALYGALKRLAGEGLIAATRSERQGNFPERTVYEITPQGRELLPRSIVRPCALSGATRPLRFGPGPLRGDG